MKPGSLTKENVSTWRDKFMSHLSGMVTVNDVKRLTNNYLLHHYERETPEDAANTERWQNYQNQ